MKIKDKLPIALFCFSIALAIFAYGIIVGRYEIFPYKLLREARDGFGKVFSPKQPWFFIELKENPKPCTHNSELAYQGLNLVTGMVEGPRMVARIIDMEGNILHEWKIDWFDIWPDAQHLSKGIKPKSRPGTHIHGAVLLDNGDLVFNFEYCGLVRLSVDGDVVWRLPYQTHHSIHMDENGDLWVSGRINRREPVPGILNYKPPFVEYTILKVSQDGEILKEIFIFDLLQKNNLAGMLYMEKPKLLLTEETGDTLHLNDVEPFPMSMQEGFFKHGDIMISLRKINAVIVFDKNEKVRHFWIGSFIKQHDPDFISGNKISLFDNNNLSNHFSKIIILSAPDNTVETYYSGTKESPFFSSIMGKHQWLPNNNLLITEPMSGRAFEITPEGEIVWEYNNLIGDKLAGIMEEVQRIPGSFSAIYAK